MDPETTAGGLMPETEVKLISIIQNRCDRLNKELRKRARAELCLSRQNKAKLEVPGIGPFLGPWINNPKGLPTSGKMEIEDLEDIK